ncbi:MAG: hypothetical protein ACUVTH_07885 [Thermogutta sp.]
MGQQATKLKKTLFSEKSPKVWAGLADNHARSGDEFPGRKYGSAGKERRTDKLSKEARLRMFKPQLRIYYGPEEEEQLGQACRADVTSVVNVPLREILPLLVDAVQSRRTWLKDFENEEITLSLDLYEVLLAYQHYRRPSA